MFLTEAITESQDLLYAMIIAIGILGWIFVYTTIRPKCHSLKQSIRSAISAFWVMVFFCAFVLASIFLIDFMLNSVSKCIG